VRLLLDTHVLIWALASPSRIPLRVRNELLKPSNDLWFSVASLIEIAGKQAAGRRSAPGISAETVMTFALGAEYRLLEIKAEHAIGIESTAIFHGDPIDRLLLVQSRQEKMRLVTHDTALAEYADGPLVF